MQHVSTCNSHLQAKLRTVIALQSGCGHLGSNMAYSVFAAFFIHNVTYIYCAIINSVWRAQICLCPLFFCFWSSSLEWGGVGGFSVHFYFCMYLLSVYRTPPHVLDHRTKVEAVTRK